MKKFVIVSIILLIFVGISVLMLKIPYAGVTAQTGAASIPYAPDASEVPLAPAFVQAETPTGNAGAPAPETPAAISVAQVVASGESVSASAPVMQAATVSGDTPLTADGPSIPMITEGPSTPISTGSPSTPITADGASIPMITEGPSTPITTGDPSAPMAQVAMANTRGSASSPSIGMTALEKAAKENQYLFVFCSDTDSPETAEAKASFESAVSKMAGTAQWAIIDKNQPSEKAALARFRLTGAPMPIIVAIAPNGAITGALYREKLKNPILRSSLPDLPRNSV